MTATSNHPAYAVCNLGITTEAHDLILVNMLHEMGEHFMTALHDCSPVDAGRL